MGSNPPEVASFFTEEFTRLQELNQRMVDGKKILIGGSGQIPTIQDIQVQMGRLLDIQGRLLHGDNGPAREYITAQLAHVVLERPRLEAEVQKPMGSMRADDVYQPLKAEQGALGRDLAMFLAQGGEQRLPGLVASAKNRLSSIKKDLLNTERGRAEEGLNQVAKQEGRLRELLRATPK